MLVQNPCFSKIQSEEQQRKKRNSSKQQLCISSKTAKKREPDCSSGSEDRRNVLYTLQRSAYYLLLLAIHLISSSISGISSLSSALSSCLFLAADEQISKDDATKNCHFEGRGGCFSRLAALHRAAAPLSSPLFLLPLPVVTPSACGAEKRRDKRRQAE